MKPFETLDTRGGYRVAKFSHPEDSSQTLVAIKSPDRVFIATEEAAEHFSFATITVDEYYMSEYKAPLAKLVDLAYSVQYDEGLLNDFRVCLLKHFVPMVLSPCQHIHHNSLQSKRIGLYNPLSPWETPEFQYSRVAMEPQCQETFGTRLSFRQETDDKGGVILRVKAKFKRDLAAMQEAFDEGETLVFSNKWDSLSLNSLDSAEKVFSNHELPETVEPESVPGRLIGEINDHESPWFMQFLLASAAYVHSRFCHDVEKELEAFKELCGGNLPYVMQATFDQKHVRPDRFKLYEAENDRTNLNAVAYDFAYPTIADQARSVKLIVELGEIKWPEKR